MEVRVLKRDEEERFVISGVVVAEDEERRRRALSKRGSSYMTTFPAQWLKDFRDWFHEVIVTGLRERIVWDEETGDYVIILQKAKPKRKNNVVEINQEEKQ